MRKIYYIISIGTFFTSFFERAAGQNLSVQSTINVTNAVSGSGNAGIVFTGSEYWVSKWYNDSVATLTSSGAVTDRFVVPGVSGIRAMTWDGSFIYAVVDNYTIYKINPVTKTQVATIASPLITRHISYSAAANSGAGGLWVGDDFGDLKLITLSGATLQTITAATHGLPAMFGSAYDSTTTNGGPYLWIFDRGPAYNTATLARIPISTGVPDYTYNVLNDFPNGGTAAGAYISFSVAPGQQTLMTLLVGATDRLISYTNSAILPVTLISFSGEKKSTMNTLKWRTASEQNSKSFELQRSADGNNFTTFASVTSKAVNGNSTAELNYSFDDVHPLKGNNYYKLRQIDKNGKATVSNTVLLKGSAVLKAELNNLYPNPVTSVINVSLNMPENSKISFTVTDMKGNLLIRHNAMAGTGNNIFTIKAENLAAGSYILKAFDGAGKSIGETAFIKQ